MTYRLFRSHRDKMSVTNATMKHTLLGIIKIYLVANFLFFVSVESSHLRKISRELPS